MQSYIGINSSCSCPVAMNRPYTQNCSWSSICTSQTPSNLNDVGFEPGRNSQNYHKPYSTVARKSESSNLSDMAVSENTAQTPDPYSENQSVCVEGYGLNVSSGICQHLRQDLEISRHSPNGPLVIPNTPSLRKNKTDKFRKLALTFQSDEKPEGVIERIRSFFVEIDDEVKVEPMTKEDTYTITFKDTCMAREALKFGKESGLR